MSEPDQERGMSQSRMLWARAFAGYAAHVFAWQFMRTQPRWRRGELKHAEQRRERAERARRQAMETIAQSTPYTAEELLAANDQFRRDVGLDAPPS
jgi:hypothetical protein